MTTKLPKTFVLFSLLSFLFSDRLFFVNNSMHVLNMNIHLNYCVIIVILGWYSLITVDNVQGNKI